MALFIIENQVYAEDSGKLKLLGVVQPLSKVVGDVYFPKNGGGKVYLIEGNDISVMAENAYPLPIIDGAGPAVESSICDLKDLLLKYDEATASCEELCAIKAKFAQNEFEDLRKNAVVLTNTNAARLMRKNEHGVYEAQKDIVELRFEQYPAFIYHGGLYVRSGYGNYVKSRFKPLVSTQDYALFCAGATNLFALKKQKNGTKFITLGALQQSFETPHGVVIEVETEFCQRYALYHFGKKMQLIFERMYDEDFDLDIETGGIAHYKRGFAGEYSLVTENYIFSKGRYMRLHVI